MQIGPDNHALSPLAEQGRAIYESRLKAILEPEHTGEAVAIHVDTEDYALGKSHSEAAHALLARHQPAGSIVVDTGFEGDLTLPASLIRQLDAQPLFVSVRSLADGSLVECPVFQLTIEWNDETRTVEVLSMEHNPLLEKLCWRDAIWTLI